ncbi:hypothetical protein PILCRDRAFT_827777 [Piloderma croceum F 1598]|uniref:Uncharacterized protein n=1 Tax=Piloderma croceum (strain F 1598) TaxID=765440 RepID=A0A0C3EQJ9_PILCF|nr:hypothetical protein PILCRDRAFT_827777 [Piloderma croceum F 1598]
MYETQSIPTPNAKKYAPSRATQTFEPIQDELSSEQEGWARGHARGARLSGECIFTDVRRAIWMLVAVAEWLIS